MLVSSLIPESHRHLRVLRLFFPGFTESGSPLRWSHLVEDPEELTFRADWYELVESAHYLGLLTEPAEPPSGTLDTDTVKVLAAALSMTGSHKFSSLFWEGYSEFLEGCEQTVSCADEVSSGCGLDLKYCKAEIVAEDLRPEKYPPSFLWDAHEELAWGSLIYPDSLFVAASPEIFKMIHQNPLVDAASVTSIDVKIPPAAAGE